MPIGERTLSASGAAGDPDVIVRPPRIQLPGAYYHAFGHATDRCDLFEERGDFEVFLHLLAGSLRERGWVCLAYCLMPNHYHVVIQTPAGDIGDGMKHLNGCYAQEFNRRHARKGHLFRDRFGSVLITSTEQLKHDIRYVDLNPVEAGLVEDPVDWEWGGHAAMFAVPRPRVTVPTAAALRFFGSDPEAARRRYRAFVLAGCAAARASHFRDGV